jgi:YVTN family beta-propeller protein
VTADFDTGQRFGAYQLGKLLGRGGMGVVYQAQHVHLGRTVALKLLAPELSGSEDFRARFLRESRLAATLDHPAIVTIYDAGDVNGVLYLAMRFVRGTDLSALLTQRGPLGATEALAVLEQVAAALDAAHVAGLVHRDVKPANVMIEGQRCYLTDFGLTKRASSDSVQLTQAGQFLGTVDYVAPEQIEGRETDGRADVYALGCVLFECLTGSRPYPRDSQIAVMYAQLREPPPRPRELRPDLPAAIDGVIDRAMAKAPEMRYGTCGQMIAAAREALAAPAAPTVPVEVELPTAPLPAAERTAAAPPPAEPITTPLQPEPVTAALPAQPPPPAAQPAKRSRSPWPFIAGAALVLALIAAVLVLSSGEEEKPAAAELPPAAAELPPAAPAKAEPRPAGVVFREDAVWVANNGANTITKYGADERRQATIRVGKRPYDVASNTDAVWVANSGSNSVQRIPVDTAKPGPEIAVGRTPLFLTAEDDFVYVSNSGDDTVTVLDASSGKQQGRPIEVGDDPRGITTGAGAVWVANSGDGSVSKIVDGKVTDTFPTGTGAANVAFGNGSVWVSNRDAGTVSRIAGRKVTSVKVGSEPLGIAFGDGYAWVANSGEDTVTKIDGYSGKPAGKKIPVPGTPTGVAAPDGSVWVTSNETGALTRIEP